MALDFILHRAASNSLTDLAAKQVFHWQGSMPYVYGFHYWSRSSKERNVVVGVAAAKL